MRTQVIALVLLCTSGCVLPSFQKVGAGGGAQDAGAKSGATCGLADQLAPSCTACINQQCCELAKPCGAGTACGADLLKPITPVTQVSTDFDQLLGCMQRQCDTACNVRWGCVGKYAWPVPTSDYSFGVNVIDFAAEPKLPLPGVTVDACQSIDPTCQNGRIAHGVTDAAGSVRLSVPPGFDGFFSFSGAGYTPSTTQWTDPIYRVSDFTQYQLNDLSLAGLAVVAGVHSSIDQPFDPNLGHLIFRVQSCLPVRYLDNPGLPYAEAEDVRVSVSPNPGGSQVVYTDKSGNLTIDLEATTSRGVGGAFSLPARNLSVSAVDTQSGLEVATGTVVVRAGSIAFMYMLPKSTR